MKGCQIVPELPEVETVRRGLAPVLEGRRVSRVVVRRPDLRWPLPAEFEERLTGRRVKEVGRRGKYLLVALDDNLTLLAHMGMSGRFLVFEEEDLSVREFARDAGSGGDAAGAGPHDHVVLEIMGSGERGPARVVFRDPRRFGAMDLTPSSERSEHRLLRNLGPEPLEREFSPDWLRQRIENRAAPVKNLLLDQRIVAGIGNIYASEALHRAGILPKRAGGRISTARIEVLVESIRKVLEDAIAAGGSTLRDFRRADGELGYFQHSFAVYDRAGKPCRKAGCRGTVRRLGLAGRSTFWCPKCQR